MTPINTPEAARLAEELQPCPFCGVRRRAAKQDAAPTSAATGKRDLQVATSASTVPAGYWLAPMKPDAGMLMAFHEGERYGFKTWGDRYVAMRDSWLARNPGACSVTDGEAKNG
jgi:hypothetical protein